MLIILQGRENEGRASSQNLPLKLKKKYQSPAAAPVLLLDSFLSGNFSHHQFLPIKENRGGRRRRRRRVKRTDANKAFSSSSSSSSLHASGREEKFTVCWLVRFMEEGGEEEEEERPPPLAFLYFNPPLFSRIKRPNFQKASYFPPWPWLWMSNAFLACLAQPENKNNKGPFSAHSVPFLP